MTGLKEKESSDEPSAKRKREEPPHESGNFMYLFKICCRYNTLPSTSVVKCKNL
jgi:hypothetical protein